MFQPGSRLKRPALPPTPDAALVADASIGLLHGHMRKVHPRAEATKGLPRAPSRSRASSSRASGGGSRGSGSASSAARATGNGGGPNGYTLASVECTGSLKAQFLRAQQDKAGKRIAGLEDSAVQAGLAAAALQLQARDRLTDLRHGKARRPMDKAVEALGQYLAEVAHTPGVTDKFQKKMNELCWELAQKLHNPPHWQANEHLVDDRPVLWIDLNDATQLAMKIGAVQAEGGRASTFKDFMHHLKKWLAKQLPPTPFPTRALFEAINV